MSKRFTISVPKNLSAIPLKHYQAYLKAIDYKESETLTDEQIEFSNLKLLECFCGLSLKEAYNLHLSEFSVILKHISDLFKENTPLQRTFTMVDPKGKERKFGFIPKIDDISLGEFIDLDKYIGDWQNMHKAMAILYRPITFQKKDLYLIEDYEGSDIYSDVMKDSPVSVSLGATLFFYHLGKELSSHMTVYLEKVAKSDSTLHQTLEQNGVGINQFMDLLKGTRQSLKRLQNSHYFNV